MCFYCIISTRGGCGIAAWPGKKTTRVGSCCVYVRISLSSPLFPPLSVSARRTDAISFRYAPLSYSLEPQSDHLGRLSFISLSLAGKSPCLRHTYTSLVFFDWFKRQLSVVLARTEPHRVIHLGIKTKLCIHWLIFQLLVRFPHFLSWSYCLKPFLHIYFIALNYNRLNQSGGSECANWNMAWSMQFQNISCISDIKKTFLILRVAWNEMVFALIILKIFCLPTQQDS